MAEKKYLGLGVSRSKPEVNQVEEQSQPGVKEREHHRDRDPIVQSSQLWVANLRTNK
jgi:hypothetical protein